MEIFGFASDFKVVGLKGKPEPPVHGSDMAEPPDDKLPEGIDKYDSCM